ncbi:hypothetical protein [uncultured Litoreibacter sp.]|uniref:hypothetical protein n=1 Tax=uncultured Litoreibacter sp. TaxID=1392394 RepID=UPI00263234E7|nr:hypothetical protein [uncultured Litoreibacter sp.]
MSKVSIAVGGVATVRFDDGVSFSFPTAINPAQVGGDGWHYYDTHSGGARAMPNVETQGASFMGFAVVHWYKYRFSVDDVWMGLRDYPALEYTDSDFDEFGDPVSTGDTTVVDLFGPVTHIVDNSKRVLINQTTPAHSLHEGYVARHVYQVGPRVFVQSVGFGVGKWARANEIPSGFVWGSVSMKSIRSMAAQYFEQRTGKDGILMENDPEFDSIPMITR